MTRVRVRRLVCGLGFAILLLPSIAMVAPRFAPRAEAAFPGRNGRIAFAVSQIPDVTGLRGGINGDLFTVAPSGAGLQKVTDGPESDDYFPAWSPDGRRIAFGRTDLGGTLGGTTGYTDIFVMDATGGQVTNLTFSRFRDEDQPSWSPDGTKIVFVRNSSSTNTDIYVMDSVSGGGNVVQLTDHPGYEDDPAWSPQGDLIVYVNLDSLDDFQSIRLIRPDGSDGRTVVPGGRRGESPTDPSWSPDGRRITFESGGEIWVVNRDGSDPRNLTVSVADDITPSWSPDGRWIAFVSDRDGDYKLYKMRADGSDVTKVVDITLTAEGEGGIDWGPRP